MILNVPGDGEEVEPVEDSPVEIVERPQEADRFSLKTPDGEVYGPVPRSEMNDWVREGRVSAECSIRVGKSGAWQPAAELYPHLAGPSAATSRPSPFAAPVYSRPVNPHPQPYQRNSNGGVILAFGILGAFFGPFAVVAWIMAASELNAMSRGEVNRNSEGLVRTGMILGIIFTALWLFFCFGGCCIAGI